MPVSITGNIAQVGNDGLVITDATANASDIMSGKVAYNNYGRVVGSHVDKTYGDFVYNASAGADDIMYGKTAFVDSGKVTGRHVDKVYSDFVYDATATPGDVANGKVFYNNNGRQVGNASSMLQRYEVTISGALGSTIDDRNNKTALNVSNGSMSMITTAKSSMSIQVAQTIKLPAACKGFIYEGYTYYISGSNIKIDLGLSYLSSKEAYDINITGASVQCSIGLDGKHIVFLY